MGQRILLSSLLFNIRVGIQYNNTGKSDKEHKAEKEEIKPSLFTTTWFCKKKKNPKEPTENLLE